MKRCILTVILILCSFFTVQGQNTTPIDLILLLDTSSGMGSSYERVSDYITGAFLSEFLRIGDTFHLITYSGSPRLDAARRITGRGDVETIIGRMLLQYPVESENNTGAAISYTEDYVNSLPSRPKKIVMVGTGATDINASINAARQRLNAKNTTLDFVLVTPGRALTNLPVSGRPTIARTVPPSVQQQQRAEPAAETTSTTAATPTAPVIPPVAADTQTATQPSAGAQTDSQLQTSTRDSDAPVSRTAIGDPDTDTGILDQQDTSLSEAGEIPGAGATDTVQADAPAQDGEPAAETGTQPVTSVSQADERQKTSSEVLISSMPLLIGIIILVLLILALILFFVFRRLGSSPNRVMASVSTTKYEKKEKEDSIPFVDHSKDLASYAAGLSRQRTTPYSDRPVKQEAVKPPVINPKGPLLLNLFVADQNTAIGKRNIHSLKSGYRLTIGGGKSDDYLIFLVPMPSNIGEIRRNGSQCSFIPRKSKYFPDIGSSEVKDCINKTIRIVSDKNYEMCFRFEMYEDPLISLNRMLHSIKVPG